MERELWPLLYHELQAAARDFRQKYVHYQPWAVVAILLWAALHDRSVYWACDARHWATTRLRPARLPSRSTVSQRRRRTAFGLFLQLPGRALPRRRPAGPGRHPGRQAAVGRRL